MENVGYAALQIIPSFKGMDGYLERGVSGPMGKAGVYGGARFGDAAGKSAGRRFGSVFAASSKIALAGALGAGALAFKVGKDSIAAASDLNESLNAVNVTYGKQAEAVKVLGTEAADALGLSNTEFNGLAVQFSAFATQVAGSDGPKVVNVLDQLTTRGSDFASVMNLEVNEALGLFQSGLAGETEPLRKFGIDLSAAAVESFAYARGIAKAGEEMTEGQKVQARYGLLMRQTAKTQGDFANTSDELANSQRRLTANWENAKARLGEALLPVLTTVTNYLIDDGIPAFEKAADFFVEDFAPAAKDLAGDLKPLASALGDVVGFINDLPSEAKIAALGGLLAGGAALKLRGGGGTALGGVGSALGMAKPVPVFVTNDGFGGGGAGGGKGGKFPGVVAGAGSVGALTLAGAAGGLGIFALQKKLFPEQVDKGYVNPAPGGIPAGVLSGDEKGEILDLRDAMQSAVGNMLSTAVDAAGNITQAFKPLPETLVTAFKTEGIPQSRGQARDLVKEYNLTPKQKQTLFELLGYSSLMSQIRQINTSLDYASRDRRTQITVAYSNAGYETKGGLQEGGGTKTTQTGPRSAGRAAQRAIDSDSRFNRWMDDRD